MIFYTKERQMDGVHHVKRKLCHSWADKIVMTNFVHCVFLVHFNCSPVILSDFLKNALLGCWAEASKWSLKFPKFLHLLPAFTTRILMLVWNQKIQFHLTKGTQYKLTHLHTSLAVPLVPYFYLIARACTQTRNRSCHASHESWWVGQRFAVSFPRHLVFHKYLRTQGPRFF